MASNRPTYVVVDFDDGKKRVHPNLMLNYNSSYADFVAHLETALRRSPSDPFVHLTKLEYRLPAGEGQPRDEDGWLLAKQDEGGRARRREYVHAVIDETTFDSANFLRLKMVRIRATGRVESDAFVPDLRHYTPRPAHVKQRSATTTTPTPPPPPPPTTTLETLQVIDIADEEVEGPIRPGAAAVADEDSDAAADMPLVSSPARRAAAILESIDAAEGGGLSSGDSHSLGSFDRGGSFPIGEGEEEDDWRASVRGIVSEDEDESPRISRSALEGGAATAASTAAAAAPGGVKAGDAATGGAPTATKALEEAEPSTQLVQEAAGGHKRMSRISRRLAFGFSRGRGRAAAEEEDAGAAIAALPPAPQQTKLVAAAAGAAAPNAATAMKAPPPPLSPLNEGLSPPRQQRKGGKKGKKGLASNKGKLSPARPSPAVDSPRGLPKGTGLFEKRKVLTPRVSEKQPWHKSLRQLDGASDTSAASANGSGGGGGGASSGVGKNGSSNRWKHGQKKRDIIDEDSSQDGSVGGPGSSCGGSGVSELRTPSGRPAARVSIGTWDRTMRHLAILKEISGKDEEELEWLATAKQGNGLGMAERSQAKEEEVYHRLLWEESCLTRERDRLANRRVETTLRGLAALAGVMDAANKAVVAASDAQVAADSEFGDIEMEKGAANSDWQRYVAEEEGAAADAAACELDGEAAEASASSSNGEKVNAAAEIARERALAANSRFETARVKLEGLEATHAAANKELLAVLGQAAAKKEAVGRLCDEEEQTAHRCEALVRLLRRLCTRQDDVAPATAVVTLKELRLLQDGAVAAVKENARALGDAFDRMEKWRRRKEALPEFERENRLKEERWFDDELCRNHEALRLVRGLMPANVTAVSRERLGEQAASLGALYPRELAAHLKEGRLLHWCVTHADDIARANFLVGEHAHFFTNLEKYDIVELRGVAAVLPSRFEPDRDGRKAAWRKDFITRLQALVAQERGEEVLGSWDPDQKARRKVRLPPLTTEQQRRPVYFYLRPEEAMARLEKLKARDAAAAAKATELAHIKEHGIPEALAEYNAVLADTREEHFRSMYTADELRSLRNEAKSAVDNLQTKAKKLERELQETERAAKTQLYTTESLQQEMDAIQILIQQRLAAKVAAAEPLAATGDDADRISAEERSLWLVTGPFDPDEELLPRAAQNGGNSVARFATPEQEAAARRQELEATFGNRRGVTATAVAEAAITPPLSPVRGLAAEAAAAEIALAPSSVDKSNFQRMLSAVMGKRADAKGAAPPLAAPGTPEAAAKSFKVVAAAASSPAAKGSSSGSGSPPRPAAVAKAAPTTPPPPPRSKALAMMLRRSNKKEKEHSATAAGGGGGAAPLPPRPGPPSFLAGLMSSKRFQQSSPEAAGTAALHAHASSAGPAATTSASSPPPQKEKQQQPSAQQTALLSAIQGVGAAREAACQRSSMTPPHSPMRGRSSLSPKRMSVDTAPAFGLVDEEMEEEETSEKEAIVAAAAAAIGAAATAPATPLAVTVAATAAAAAPGGRPLFAAELQAAMLRRREAINA